MMMTILAIPVYGLYLYVTKSLISSLNPPTPPTLPTDPLPSPSPTILLLHHLIHQWLTHCFKHSFNQHHPRFILHARRPRFLILFLHHIIHSSLYYLFTYLTASLFSTFLKHQHFNLLLLSLRYRLHRVIPPPPPTLFLRYWLPASNLLLLNLLHHYTTAIPSFFFISWYHHSHTLLPTNLSLPSVPRQVLTGWFPASQATSYPERTPGVIILQPGQPTHVRS